MKTTRTRIERLVTVTLFVRDVILDAADVPENRRASAEVYVKVPGGGDWSNMDLDVTELCVRWQEEETTETVE